MNFGFRVLWGHFYDVALVSLDHQRKPPRRLLSNLSEFSTNVESNCLLMERVRVAFVSIAVIGFRLDLFLKRPCLGSSVVFNDPRRVMTASSWKAPWLKAAGTRSRRRVSFDCPPGRNIPFHFRCRVGKAVATWRRHCQKSLNSCCHKRYTRALEPNQTRSQSVTKLGKNSVKLGKTQ